MFFEQHYQSVFHQYEHDCILSLRTYITNEIATVLNECWKEEDAKLSADNIDAFDQILRLHFNDVMSKDTLALFLELKYEQYTQDENGEDDPVLSTCYTGLQSKTICISLIEDLIRKKLIKERVLINIEDIKNDPSLQEKIKLAPDVTWSNVLGLYEAIQNNTIDKLFQNPDGIKAFNSYPDLVLNHLKIDPNIIVFLPNTDLITNQKVIAIYADRLRAALKDKSDCTLDLITKLLIFVADAPLELSCLPGDVLNNPTVASHLLSSNGMLWTLLEESLQTNAGLRDLALKQNPAIGCYFSEDLRKAKYEELYQALALEAIPVERKDLNGLPISEQIKAIQSLQAMSVLYTKPELAIPEFLEHIQYIDPFKLINIQQIRKQRGLLSLPLCDNRSGLEKFVNEIKDQLGTDIFNKNTYEIRNLAVHNTNKINKHHAVMYLARNKSWFQSFVQYRAMHTGEGQAYSNLYLCVDALMKMIGYSLAVVLLIKASMIGVPLIYHSLKAVATIFLLSSVLLYMLNWCLQSRTLGTIADVFYRLGYVDVEFYVCLARVVLNLTYQFFLAFSKVVGHIFQGSRALGSSLGTEQVSNDWLAQCDAIIARFSLLNNSCSVDKKNILIQLKDQMQNEPLENQNPALIEKQYNIEYKGKTYEVSFSDVAKIRRDEHTPFSLEKNTSKWCSMFRMQSSSERLVAGIKHDMPLLPAALTV